MGSVEKLSTDREWVLKSFEAAEVRNRREYLAIDEKATSEYIYPNQMEDAVNIVDAFYKNKRRVISIQKKTKVGADGLMLHIAKLMTTHPDDDFVVDPTNVRIMTGMSNKLWETEMIKKTPECFKEIIFHHGKLSKTQLEGMKNSLLIIDEIDSGDKEGQVLHKTLIGSGIMDVEHMESNNIRFVVISATMIKQLYAVYRWGELHQSYVMTIPASYIGHIDFLEKKLIKDSYALTEKKAAEKWVQEDIIDNYGTDYRVHLVRVNPASLEVVQSACISKGVSFTSHDSADRKTEDQLIGFFEKAHSHHIVIGVKGFFRRANLIPNRWKIRVGAVHEIFTKNVDYSVQIQGLVGRMTGYWRDVIEGGHKTGPYRTSIRAIEEYEKTYTDPLGFNSYQTTGFNKKNGKVNETKTKRTMLAPECVKNLEAVELPEVDSHPEYDLTELYDNHLELCKSLKSNITGSTPKYRLDAESGTIQYRGKPVSVHEYETKENFKNKDIYWGINKQGGDITGRIMPVKFNGSIKWIGIYLKSAV